MGEEIGAGAVGRVVEVKDEGGSLLAGKILHLSHRGDAAAETRFANEADLLDEIRHENLVRVFGIEEIEGEQVLLMERIVGDSLATMIAKSAPLAESEIVRLSLGIARGLSAAHHAGLIHRDLKPANILVAGGETPKIVDFGMARANSFAGIDEGALAVVGTPAYMAPESANPMAVDARSDLYALGCMMFEMATGRVPYSAPTSIAVLEKHRRQAVPQIGASFSPNFTELVRALLAKSPADRPQSAAMVAETLESFAGSRTRALAKRDDSALGRCASCGASLVPGVDVCFGCGEEQPTLHDGKFTVFVTGPGEIAGKLDIKLRKALLDWLRANPSLGLDPEPLAKTVPRLPFVLTTAVSQVSAESLVAAVKRLGLEAEAKKGGAYSLKSLRKKAWKLGGRVALIVGTSGVYMWQSMGAIIAPMAALGVLGSLGAGWQMAARKTTKKTKSNKELPESLAASLDRVAGVLPAMSATRHRQNLRAVVQRVMSLRDFFAERKVEGFDAELCNILDIAVVASSRIDELESALERGEIRSADEDLRAELLERDRWSARLMEITASLESLRARFVAGEIALAGQEREASLADLRAQVEALQEVQAL